MSPATMTDTQPPALQAFDGHDLIRVHGARENNLKDVSVEIPKRRPDGVSLASPARARALSCSNTIAAESQRLINETYSTFVQGFMPTLARPEVDVLEGLTTAIIVDQQRIGADARSTVGTATDANAMLRILFSRLGQRKSARPTRLVQRPLGPSDRRDHDRTRCRQDRETDLHPHRRHVSALRRPRHRLRHRPHTALRRRQVARRGRHHHPRVDHGELLHGDDLHRLGRPRPEQADSQVHKV